MLPTFTFKGRQYLPARQFSLILARFFFGRTRTQHFWSKIRIAGEWTNKKVSLLFYFPAKKIQRPFKAFTFSPPGDFWGSSVKDESSVNEPVFYSTGKSLFLKCPPVIVYSETVLLREFANLLSRAGVGFRESRSLHFYSSRKRGPHKGASLVFGSRQQVCLFHFPRTFYWML